MRAAHVAEIHTPKGFMLNGLWFGIHSPHTVYIWVHGLGSSAFSKMDIMQLLAKNGAAVLAFSNRGHDRLSTASWQRGTKTGRKLAGGGAEVFEECIDDIDGAISLARASGAKHIYLIGHSTGCQKSIYWASKRKKGVDGIILLAPISDYAAGVMIHGQATIDRVAEFARSMAKKGNGDELIPLSMWSEAPMTAARFLSLNTKESVEEIFSYSHDRAPKILQSVKIPILALLAEKDEYADRPATELYEWFLAHIYEGGVSIVADVAHSFKGGEKTVAREINRWIGLRRD